MCINWSMLHINLLNIISIKQLPLPATNKLEPVQQVHVQGEWKG